MQGTGHSKLSLFKGSTPIHRQVLQVYLAYVHCAGSAAKGTADLDALKGNEVVKVAGDVIEDQAKKVEEKEKKKREEKEESDD